MEPETVKLSDFIKKTSVSLVYRKSDRNPHMEDFEGDHYRVTLRRGSKRMTFYYSKGYGLNGEPPTVEEVLDCLASDAAGVQDAGADFAEWASEYGYDTDSRKANKIFTACLRQAERLKSLFSGAEYETLLWHTERL
jgi:hypothetical protein